MNFKQGSDRSRPNYGTRPKSKQTVDSTTNTEYSPINGNEEAKRSLKRVRSIQYSCFNFKFLGQTRIRRINATV